MNLAGKEDYKGICEDARLEDRAHFELVTPRIYELGGQGGQQPQSEGYRRPISWKCSWRRSGAPSAPGARSAI